MEQKDLELEQRVWQRVSGGAPAGECAPARERTPLGEMEQRCRESATAFRHLAQCSTGQMREALQELYSQEQSNALALMGMRILSGEEPEKTRSCPWAKTGTCRALALAYRRSCQAREDYAAHGSGGEYAQVFSAMEREEREKMRRLLALIALSKGG